MHFSEVGQRSCPTCIRRWVDPNDVGNHSYSHNLLLGFRPTLRIVRNLERTSTLIVEATGQHPVFFRPPNGLMTAQLQAACEQLGLKPLGVHVYVHDSRIGDPEEIADRVLRRIKGDAYVIVLHDGSGTQAAPLRAATAKALKIIIPELNRRGYRWVTPERFEEEFSGR